MLLTFRFRLTCLLVASILSACGGGGGGEGGTPVDPGAGGTSTGLVPAAPEVGATLYANAADLRPLIDGARWLYRGTSRPGGGDPTTFYTASVSQALVGGSLQETERQVFLEDSSISALSQSDGNIVAQISDPMGIGSSEVVAMTELRSPVRINDQYTQYERRDVPMGTDIDADGRSDIADVAIYSRVIGDETVELPELARTVTAVKVETTALVRVKNSSSASQPLIVTLVQTQWYASGIGVVRRTLSSPTTNGSVGALDFDEVLFNWDGVTQGLGALGPTGAALPEPEAATVLGDRALVLAKSTQPSDPGTLTFGVFDKRGSLLSTRRVPGLGESRYAVGAPGLFAIDTNTALAAIHVGTSPGTLRLQRVDADGVPLGGASTLTVPTNNANLAMSWDGQALWIAFLSTGSQVSDSGKLMLQPFTADGDPLAPAQMLDAPTVSGYINGIGMSAAAGRLLVSWARNEIGVATYRYAMLRGSSSMADVRALGTVQRWSTSHERVVVPILANDIAALLWNGPVFSYDSAGPLPDSLPRGVVLDAGGVPLRSVGNLDDETLPAAWAGNTGRTIAQALGDRLVVSGFDSQRATPQIPGTKDFFLTAFVHPGGRPLTTAAASATALSSPTDIANISGPFGLPAFMLLWDDRALLIGVRPGTAMTSVFWLR